MLEPCCSLPCLSALKWYRANCNIQTEIEEMQEEQRSLSTLETLSVWRLVRDDTVRWQVLSVAVINIGMQLSSIDAVSSLLCSLANVLSNILGGWSIHVSLNFSEYIKKRRGEFSLGASRGTTQCVLSYLIEAMSCGQL